jgi:hypothetical protein
MADVMWLNWLLWIGLYLILGLLVPWATSVAWVHQHNSNLETGLRHLFERGELGLVGLVISIAMIWDLLQSQYMPHTRAVAAILFAVCGTMAGSVWIETHCRRRTGADYKPERAWQDSRKMVLLIFSMAAVVEILLDRFAKVVAQ